MMTNIYTLNCPISNDVKYVGKTILSLKERLWVHVSSPAGKENKKWINDLKSKSLKPTIKLVEEVTAIYGKKREIHWINYYLKLGLELTNSRYNINNNVVMKENTKQLLVAKVDEKVIVAIEKMAKKTKLSKSFIANELLLIALKK